MENIFGEFERIRIVETEITDLKNNNIIKFIMKKDGYVQIKTYKFKTFTEIEEFTTSSGLNVDEVRLLLGKRREKYYYRYFIHESTTSEWTCVENLNHLKWTINELIEFMRGIVGTNCQIEVIKVGKSEKEKEKLVKIMMEEVEKRLSRTDVKLVDMFANLI